MKFQLIFFISVLFCSSCGRFFVHQKRYPAYFTPDLKYEALIYEKENFRVKLSVEVDLKLRTDTTTIYNRHYLVFRTDGSEVPNEFVSIEGLTAISSSVQEKKIKEEVKDTTIHRIEITNTSGVYRILIPFIEVQKRDSNFEDYNLELTLDKIRFKDTLLLNKKLTFICKTH